MRAFGQKCAHLPALMQIFDQNLDKSAQLAKNARIFAENACFYANFGKKMRAVGKFTGAHLSFQ